MKGRFRGRLRPYDILTLSYVFFMGAMVFVFGRDLEFRWVIASLHVLALFFLVVLIFKADSEGFLGFLRDLYPVFLLPLFYEEMRFTDHMFFKGYLDRYIVGFEKTVFGFHPNIAVSHIYRPFLTELMTVFYFSYYPMVLVPPFVLRRLGRRKDLFRFLNAVMLSYYLSFAFSTIFPVESPRFFLSGSVTAPKGYLLTRLHDMFMAFGSFRGNGMPSSHVAATLSSVLVIKNMDGRLFVVMFFVFLLMCFSTVYGCYHYVLDVAGGLAVGLLSYFITNRAFHTK